MNDKPVDQMSLMIAGNRPAPVSQDYVGTRSEEEYTLGPVPPGHSQEQRDSLWKRIMALSKTQQGSLFRRLGDLIPPMTPQVPIAKQPRIPRHLPPKPPETVDAGQFRLVIPKRDK